MVFEIEAYVGAGSLHFGMTSGQVSSALNSIAQKFFKTEFSQMETDAFEWCHAYYKQDGLLEAVEFFEPAEVKFMGKDLLGLPFENVKDMFSQLDEKLKIDANGFTSYKFGVGIYVPYHEAQVEGVIVFENGYYDI